MTNNEHALLPEERRELVDLVAQRVRSVPDFPKPGILFRDITPVLAHADTLRAALKLHAHAICDLIGTVDKVVGIESRGFLFGMALASRIGAGFALVRKPGKLPAETIETTYALEYGTDRLQMHVDAVEPGERCIIVDDLLATGGTADAARTLVQKLKGELLASLFLIELEGLGGRARLTDTRVETILRYA